MSLHPLATAANATLEREAPFLLQVLSGVGRRMYFPSQGILAQGAEAKAKARRANATVGIATEGGMPMHLPVVHRHFQGLTPSEIYEYAPSFGRPDLRKAWAAKQRRETPSLGSHPVSLPVVTNALTHGLSVVGDLFLDPGDEVLTSDLMWENYCLGWEVRLGVRLSTFPLFDEGLHGFNLPAFQAALSARQGGKLLVALNFPNNPSGYTPTRAEAEGIVAALTACAAAGTRLVVLCDDAYYGMFFDPCCQTESLFGRLAQAHPHLLAIRVDGFTKEAFAWGLRVGFVTYGLAGATQATYEVLEQKTAGLIRGTVSNITQPGQSLLAKALADTSFAEQQAAKVEILRRRAAAVRAVCRLPGTEALWDVYPFNSGYFMCLRLKTVDADTLRRHLLEQHGVGTIALGSKDLRVAFSCLEEAQIPEVFQHIAAAIRELGG